MQMAAKKYNTWALAISPHPFKQRRYTYRLAVHDYKARFFHVLFRHGNMATTLGRKRVRFTFQLTFTPEEERQAFSERIEQVKTKLGGRRQLNNNELFEQRLLY